MLRFEVSEDGQGTLPAIDLAEEPVVIGSGPEARLRLPASIARAAHVRIRAGKWDALDDVIVDGTPRTAGESGTLEDAGVFELGRYRVRVTSAPTGAPASTPQRTESIARELVRAMLGAGAAPSFAIEHGPDRGSLRPLPPPEATIVIGRGDDADWIILDEDLSRLHAEVRRGWDGVTIRDRGSKNGTLVDGVPAIAEGTLLRDGATIAMGKVVLRFHDPAESHLVGDLTPAFVPPSEPRPPRTTVTHAVAPAVERPPPPRWWVLVSSSTVAALALAALVYVVGN